MQTTFILKTSLVLNGNKRETLIESKIMGGLLANNYFFTQCKQKYASYVRTEVCAMKEAQVAHIVLKI